MSYVAPIKDMLFCMKELAAIDEVAKLPGFEEAGLDTAQAVLEECAKLNQDVIAPLNWEGDKYPSSWHDGKVTTTPGFKEAFRQFGEGGWQGLQHPTDFGGQGLPKTIGAACIEMLNSANMSFALCPLLTDGAIEALLTAGTPEQQATFIPKMVSGEWTGTMNLTEPQAGSDLAFGLQRGTPARHQLRGFHCGQLVQRLWPVAEVGVAGIGRGVELDQVAAEQDLLLRQPGHRVALGVAAAELQQLHFQLAEPQRHLAGEGQGRPGQARRHALDVAEQAREAADLAGLVLLAALDDQVVGVLAGDDLLRLVSRGAEHAHRVVVRQQHVLDRLVGHLADATDHVLRHHRRGLGVEHQHRVVADDHAGVGVALGGVGVGVVGQLGEADLLLFQVGLAGECLGTAHRAMSP